MLSEARFFKKKIIRKNRTINTNTKRKMAEESYFESLQKQQQQQSKTKSPADLLSAIQTQLKSRMESGEVVSSDLSAEKLRECVQEMMKDDDAMANLEKGIRDSQFNTVTKSKRKKRSSSSSSDVSDSNTVRELLKKYKKFPSLDKVESFLGKEAMLDYKTALEKLEDGLGQEITMGNTGKKESVLKYHSLMTDVISLYGTGTMKAVFDKWVNINKRKSKNSKGKAETLSSDESMVLQARVAVLQRRDCPTFVDDIWRRNGFFLIKDRDSGMHAKKHEKYFKLEQAVKDALVGTHLKHIKRFEYEKLSKQDRHENTYRLKAYMAGASKAKNYIIENKNSIFN